MTALRLGRRMKTQITEERRQSGASELLGENVQEQKLPSVFRSYIVVVVFAGAADAAEQPVHHLDETEDALQARSDQQGAEQAQVELHHVIGQMAPIPDILVTQVCTGAVQHREGRVGVNIQHSFQTYFP